ncbi:MAG: DUF1570 domain-containing protein [Planctomycetota bacterium]
MLLVRSLAAFLAINLVTATFLLAGSNALAQGQPDDDGAGERKGTPIVPAQGVGKLDLKELGNKKPTEPKVNTTYVRGAGGGALVAKVLTELEDDRLIKLPTGELEVVARKDTRPTDKPFSSASRQQVIDRLKADKFGDFTFVPSGYYIFAYKEGGEAFYIHSRSIMESMLAGVIGQLREWGLEPHRPETPLVVIIMPNREEFDALEKMPRGVAAYYSGLKNYVVLYEDTELFESAPEYAFKEACYTIAHEGIHQVLANTGIQQRLSMWPSWISEGLPEYFCPLKVNTKLVKVKDGELPERSLRWQRPGMVNDMRMSHLLKTPPRGGQLVQGVVSPGQLTAYGYAVSWGLVHFLSEKRPEKFAAYLRDISESKPLMPVVDREHRGPDPFFVKHFGDNYAAIEAGVQRHLTSKPVQKLYRDPAVYQTYYVLKVIYKQGRNYTTEVGLTLSPAEAKKWRDDKEEVMAAAGRKAKFYTIICKTRKEAEYQLIKLMR